ncbi:MAG: dTDP-4-dehydrorhamnose 3,5-epimerase [Bacillota bacterium]
MRGFTFLPGRLAGVCSVLPFYAGDCRGYFLKGYERDEFLKAGIDLWVQESFETFSANGVLRGLHFQRKAPQAKLVRVLQGTVFDVAVDLRRDSATFGQWEGYFLDDREHRALYIPPGFAHGFLVVSESARVNYQCAGAYRADSDAGIVWNDPEVGVAWPLHLVKEVILSPRDQGLPGLRECVRMQGLPEEERDVL